VVVAFVLMIVEEPLGWGLLMARVLFTAKQHTKNVIQTWSSIASQKKVGNAVYKSLLVMKPGCLLMYFIFK
jgi:hypothetical protein